MSAPHRKTCLLLLLAVLAGHALLTLHVTSHVLAERQGCELCTQYSGIEHAPAPPAPEVFPLALDAAPSLEAVALLAPAPFTDRRQRGPPAGA